MQEKKKRRPTKVEKHPQRKQIEQELAEGVQIASISKKYGIHRNALTGYKRYRIPQAVVRAAEHKAITDAEQLFQIILKAVQRMETLSDSCDEYLQDPKQPDKYWMGPEADDIDVRYIQRVIDEDGQTRTIRDRCSLQDLIDNIEVNDTIVTKYKIKHTDPRILLVKASETLTKQMDTLVQAWQAIDQGKNTFLGTPAWNEVVRCILDATDDAPEVRRRIADGLAKISS